MSLSDINYHSGRRSDVSSESHRVGRIEMEFAEREIELARDMKNAGIKWKPEFGDWYCSNWRVDLFVTWPDSREKFIEYNIWLPLWHQGRQILAENRIDHIRLHELSDVIAYPVIRKQLDCYERLFDGHLILRGSIKGETDLDVLYQAILLFVLPQKEE